MGTKISIVLGFLLISNLGCQKEPSQQDYDDVAAGVAALVAPSTGGGGEVGSMSDAVVLSLGQSADGITATGSNSHMGTHAGLQYMYTLTCQNALGMVMDACSPLTNTAHLALAWSGSVTLPKFQGSVERTGDWTVASLQSAISTFNGTGTFDVSASYEGIGGVTRTFALTYTAQYKELQYRKLDHRLIGGSIRYDIHAERKRTGVVTRTEAKFDMEAVITFSDQATATVVLDGKRTYQLSLVTGQVVRSGM